MQGIPRGEALRMTREMSIAAIDHLVYAAPDLAEAVRIVEARLGAALRAGGQHPGRGTRNALLSLGPGVYLEVIGPDPDQPAPSSPRWFGIDTLRAPALVTWAARSSRLDDDVAVARSAGVKLGAVLAGRRAEPDGRMLSWRCTDPTTVVGGGLVPFLIDWAGSPHPSDSAPSSVRLLELRGGHPDPDGIRRQLAALGACIEVALAPAPSLAARLSTAVGEVELR